MNSVRAHAASKTVLFGIMALALGLIIAVPCLKRGFSPAGRDPESGQDQDRVPPERNLVTKADGGGSSQDGRLPRGQTTPVSRQNALGDAAGASREQAPNAQGTLREEYRKGVAREVHDLLAKKDFQAAIRRLEDAISSCADETTRDQWKLDLASVWILLGELEKAEGLLAEMKAASSTPEIQKQARLKLYGLYKAEGRLREYAAALMETVEKDPGNVAAVRELVEIYSVVIPDQEMEKAYLERLINLAKDRVAMVRLSQIYTREQQYDQAADLCDEMSALDRETSASANLRKALILIQAGKTDDAAQVCADIFEMAEADGRTLLKVGQIYDRLGECQNALAAFRLGRHRANAEFRRQRCALEACRMLTKLGRGGEAKGELALLATTAMARAVKEEAKQLLEEIGK